MFYSLYILCGVIKTFTSLKNLNYTYASSSSEALVVTSSSFLQKPQNSVVVLRPSRKFCKVEQKNIKKRKVFCISEAHNYPIKGSCKTRFTRRISNWCLRKQIFFGDFSILFLRLYRNLMIRESTFNLRLVWWSF